MSVLKIKNAQGEWQEVPFIKGDNGEDGTSLTTIRPDRSVMLIPVDENRIVTNEFTWSTNVYGYNGDERITITTLNGSLLSYKQDGVNKFCSPKVLIHAPTTYVTGFADISYTLPVGAELVRDNGTLTFTSQIDDITYKASIEWCAVKQGVEGDDYILTEEDKEDIAGLVDIPIQIKYVKDDESDNGGVIEGRVTGDYANVASGSFSHAEGTGNTASGISSHAEGAETTASGGYAHAEGASTEASGGSSHAEGSGTIASGQGSHAEGTGTKAANYYAHAEGGDTIASGICSHAEGNTTWASGYMSHAEGSHTIAQRAIQHVSGKYNIVDSGGDGADVSGNYATIVGNGTDENHRSNAYTLDWDGNGVYSGKLTVGTAPTNDMDVATKKYVDDVKGASIHICSSAEYDSTTRVPTIQNPDERTFYLVPSKDGTSPDLFVEWAYVNNAWEMFGSASIDLSNYVTNTDYATNEIGGVVRVNGYGLKINASNGIIQTSGATSGIIKSATGSDAEYRPITPLRQHESVFYGLAKASGDTTQSASSNPVGQYTDEAKASIKTMLGIDTDLTELEQHIDEVEDKFYIFVGNQNLDITDVGYIRLNNATVDFNNKGTSASWKYKIIDCQEGDVFTISGGSSGSAARLWAIVDAEYNVLSVASEGATADNLQITIPENGRYFVVNWALKVNNVANTVTVSKPNESAQLMINDALQYLTPEMYGAIGDGVADDSTAIQNCVNDAITYALPVKGFNTYATTQPISIVGRYLNIYFHKIVYSGSDVAVVLTGRYNNINIDVINAYDSTGCGFRLTTSVTEEATYNEIHLGYVASYGNGIECLNPNGEALQGLYYNKVYVNQLISRRGHCIYINATNRQCGENSFWGKHISNANGYFVYSENSGNNPTNRFYEFCIESASKNGVYGMATLINCRTTECMDRKRADNDEGTILKFENILPMGEVINTPIDYLCLDVSGASSYESRLDLIKTRYEGGSTKAEAFDAGFPQEMSYVIGKSLRLWDYYSVTDQALGNNCPNGKLIAYFNHKGFVPDIDWYNLITDTEYYTLTTDHKVPTIFDIDTTTTIHLDDSYCPIGINEFRVIQYADKKATIYDHNNNLIFNGANYGAGTFVIRCHMTDHTFEVVTTNETLTYGGNSTRGKYFGMNEAWDVEQVVNDIQINGASIVSDGVAEIQEASENKLGVIKYRTNGTEGIQKNATTGRMTISAAYSALIKTGADGLRPIVPTNQHIATFYGLAKASGVDEKDSTFSVGTYTDEAKTSIKQMLGVVDSYDSLVVNVTGTDPVITGSPSYRYNCGEVASLTVTPPTSGTIDIIFTSGTTPTVLDLPQTVKMPSWWIGTEANTTYEICITDATYCGVMSWDA